MNFKLYALSEPFPPFYKNAIAEYEKRLSRYCKIQYEVYKSPLSFDNALMALQDKPKVFKIAVEIGAGDISEISSEDLAKNINLWGVNGCSDIAFVLCTPSSGNLPFTSDFKLSLSAMTMSTSLLTTLVYEQIYRAYRILNNQPYHK